MIVLEYWSFILKKKHLISINGKKKFKRILSCLFSRKRKVQVTKFALVDFIFVVFCCKAEHFVNRKVVNRLVNHNYNKRKWEELTSELLTELENWSLPASSVGISLGLAAFGSSFDAKYSRTSAFCFFLFTTLVFAAVRTHFPRENTRARVAVNKQLAFCHVKRQKVLLLCHHWHGWSLPTKTGHGWNGWSPQTMTLDQPWKNTSSVFLFSVL